MSIELMVRDSYENVQLALRSTLTECGFSISEQPMPPGNNVRMCMWSAERGNKLLASFLGFLFKVERVQTMLTAYQDGTVALAVHDGGSSGGDMLGVGGGMLETAATVAAGGAQESKAMAEVAARLSTKLGAAAYPGKPAPGALVAMG